LPEFAVVGIGPGSRDYMMPLSLRIVEESDLLIGGERQLAMFRYLEKEEICLKGDYGSVFPRIRKECRKKKIALLVSGDPGYHSLLGKVSREFLPEEYKVYPGLSSFQLAMSRIGKCWDQATLISLHGKDLELIDLPLTGSLVMLTDRKNTPHRIAGKLMKGGRKGCFVYIAENLSYENERIRKMKVEDVKEEEYALCVMIAE